MKKLFVAGIAAALCSTRALAADMAVKAPRPVPSAPVYSWTGFYVGANMGYGWDDSAVTFSGNDPTAIIVTCGGGGFGNVGGTCVPPTSFKINGPLGGLQAGYDWQINQRWLLGLETDFDWSRIKGSGSSNFKVAGNPTTFSASEDVTRFGTVRARFGFLPTSTLLAYVTGGLAYGRVEENAALNSSTALQGQFGAFGYTCGPGGNNCFVGGSSRTATGWTLGGGFEYILSQNISLKAEYLYVNLGRGDTVNVVAQSTAGLIAIPSSFSATYSTVDFNLVRGGLNFRF